MNEHDAPADPAMPVDPLYVPDDLAVNFPQSALAGVGLDKAPLEAATAVMAGESVPCNCDSQPAGHTFSANCALWPADFDSMGSMLGSMADAAEADGLPGSEQLRGIADAYELTPPASPGDPFDLKPPPIPGPLALSGVNPHHAAQATANGQTVICTCANHEQPHGFGPDCVEWPAHFNLYRPDGLYNKYNVRRTDGRDAPGGDKHGATYFVLDYVNDRHALTALSAYAESVAGENPSLAGDLRQLTGQAAPIPERFPTVCLVGSTRFMDEIRAESERLTLSGHVVVAPCIVTSEQVTQTDPEVKQMLTDLHFRKIDMASIVHVVNPGGYVGESTSAEIEYAIHAGKFMTYMEPTA